MGIWHSRQTTSLRGNRFYRRPERSHCFGLSLFRQPTLSWTLLPTIHESRTFVGDPDCASVGEKSRLHSLTVIYDMSSRLSQMPVHRRQRRLTTDSPRPSFKDMIVLHTSPSHPSIATPS